MRPKTFYSVYVTSLLSLLFTPPPPPLNNRPQSPPKMTKPQRTKYSKTTVLIFQLLLGILAIFIAMGVLTYYQYQSSKVHQKIADSMKMAHICQSSIAAAARNGLIDEPFSFTLSTGNEWTNSEFNCGDSALTIRKFNPNMTSRLNSDGSGIIALEIFDLTGAGSIDEVVLIPFADHGFLHRMTPADFVRGKNKKIATWKCGPANYEGKDILLKYLPENCQESDIESWRQR